MQEVAGLLSVVPAHCDPGCGGQLKEEEAMVKATTMNGARRDFISTTLSCMIEVSVAAVVLLCVFIQSVSGVTCPMQQSVCVCAYVQMEVA